MTAVVVDASVAVKWVVNEEGSDEAASLARHELWAPDLLLIECANALWAKALRGELSTEEVRERIDALQSVPVATVPPASLLEDATSLALQLEHPVYDCLYLALALQWSVPVVTADRRFLRAVRQHEVLAEDVWALDELAELLPPKP